MCNDIRGRHLFLQRRHPCSFSFFPRVFFLMELCSWYPTPFFPFFCCSLASLYGTRVCCTHKALSRPSLNYVFLRLAVAMMHATVAAVPVDIFSESCGAFSLPFPSSFCVLFVHSLLFFIRLYQYKQGKDALHQFIFFCLSFFPASALV